MPPVRRLAAILAADVAGYSRLMGTDEEGTHERLKGHLSELIEPKIAEHRGRIVKTTGDGVLAEFASVVDAVRCAGRRPAAASPFLVAHRHCRHPRDPGIRTPRRRARGRRRLWLQRRLRPTPPAIGRNHDFGDPAGAGVRDTGYFVDPGPLQCQPGRGLGDERLHLLQQIELVSLAPDHFT
jgi:hypothetical protein